MSKTTNYHFEFASKTVNGLNSHYKAPRRSKKRLGNINTPVRIKNALKTKIEAKFSICQGSVELRLPIVTVSEANNFEHWTKKHKRHRLQQKTVAIMLNPLRDKISLPCHVKLTRLAPRKVDKWDNLPMSLKYILDICCAILTGDFRPGRADDDDRITVSYDQQTSSQYGVVIEFTFSEKIC